MGALNTVTLISNGLTLALASVLLLLLLWQDPRSPLNLLFAFFLLMVLIWATGSLFARSMAFISGDAEMVAWGLRMLEFGYIGSCVALYLFTSAMVIRPGSFFYVVSALGVGLLFVYQLVVLFSSPPPSFWVPREGMLGYELTPRSALFYILIQALTIFLVWRYRRKIREPALKLGIVLFALVQMGGLISPYLRQAGLAVTLGAPAVAIMSYAMVHQQVMLPLLGRAAQLETVREIGLAITSRLGLQEVLSSVAAQAAGLIGGDGAAIFLLQGEQLVLAAVYNVPEPFVGHRLQKGEGVAWKVVETGGSVMLADYRHWKGEPEMPMAREAFGSMIAVPLRFGDEIVGVLEVIERRLGRVFDDDDRDLLEMLAPQAAVAVMNGRLFEQQRSLAAELASAKSQLETVLASTNNPVIAVDRAMRVILANPAACDLLAPGKGRIEGELLTEFAPREFFPPDIRAALRDMRRERAHTYEIHAHGRTYLCNVAMLGWPRAQGWVAVLNDVTRLIELDRLKSQMIRMTSHDLKNPLFAAMSYTELLLEEGEAVLDDDLRHYIDEIWHQLERMNRIITGILDLERVQAGTPAYERCDLAEIVRDIVGEMRSQAEAKRQELGLDVSDGVPSMLGDPQQLAQAVVNLVDNAIKFTPEGGRIEVRLRTQNGHILLEVEDNGIGIPEDAQAHVFERFFRAYQRGAENVEGSGLGLSLVKAIVDGHNGRIWFESREGEGTTFSILFPAVEADVA